MADYLPNYNDSYALIIGIDSYKDQRFQPLGNAEDDAREVAAILEAAPYNFQVRMLLGRQATKENILDALFALRQTQADDRIIVYFAGHGYTTENRFGHETGYIAAYDTQVRREYTAIELEEVTDLRLNAEAKHIAFIFDACYSGQILGLSTMRSVTADNFLTRRAYQAISAGAGDQTVEDLNSMTDLFANELRQRNTGDDGLLTLNEIGYRIQLSMSGRSKGTQIPQFGQLPGSQGADFIFYARPDAGEGISEPEPIFEASPETTFSLPFSPQVTAGVLGGLAVIIVLLIIFWPNKSGPELVDPSGHIVFTCFDGSFDQICVIDAAKQGVRLLTNDEATDFFPNLSADGRRVVFSSRREGSFDIYIMNVDGGGVTRLTKAHGSNFAPALSPSGDRIVFTSTAQSGNTQHIWVMDVDGSNMKQLTDGPGDQISPVWSPDGKFILYADDSDDDGFYQLFTMHADGGELRQITDMDQIGGRADWSRDGESIVFFAGESGNRQIYSMDAEGSNLKQLTEEGDNLSPAFSPDGEWIVFVSKRDGDNEIYMMRADGSDQRQLTDNIVPDWQPRWGP